MDRIAALHLVMRRHARRVAVDPLAGFQPVALDVERFAFHDWHGLGLLRFRSRLDGVVLLAELQTMRLPDDGVLAHT